MTGMGETTLKKVVEKAFKRELLMQLQSESRERKEVFCPRKEKLLSLKQGSFNSFANAVSGSKEPDPDTLEFEKFIVQDDVAPKAKKPKRSKKKKIKKEVEDTDDELDSDSFQMQDVEVKEEVIVYLDLDAMEVCRICLQNSENLIPLFKKSKTMSASPAELVNYCFPNTVSRKDDLPQQICPDCLQQIQNACQLKNNFMESIKIMKNCLTAKISFQVPEKTEVLRDYVTGNQEDFMEDDDNTMMEDYLFDDDGLVTQPIVKLEADEETPITTRNERKIMSHPEMRPLKCYLCDCDFETTPEEHFEAQHSLVEVMRCSRCEFETEFPWYLFIKFQINLMIKFAFFNKVHESALSDSRGRFSNLVSDLNVLVH
jgi:hypothetical protein